MISPAPPLHPLARRSIVFTSLGVLHLLPVLGGLLGMRYGLRAVAAIRASGGAWRGEQAAFRSLFIGLLSAIVSTALLCLAIIVYRAFNRKNERRNEEAVKKSEIQLAYEAVHTYADRHEGRLPPDIATLVRDGLLLPQSVTSYRKPDGAIALRLAVRGTWAAVTNQEHTLCVEAEEPASSGRIPRVYMDGRFEFLTPR
ncbi:MAG: hypothetical protein U1F87_14520 [Kiritimatiellia bacterium]